MNPETAASALPVLICLTIAAMLNLAWRHYPLDPEKECHLKLTREITPLNPVPHLVQPICFRPPSMTASQHSER